MPQSWVKCKAAVKMECMTSEFLKYMPNLDPTFCFRLLVRLPLREQNLTENGFKAIVSNSKCFEGHTAH